MRKLPETPPSPGYIVKALISKDMLLAIKNSIALNYINTYVQISNVGLVVANFEVICNRYNASTYPSENSTPSQTDTL